MKEKVDNFDLMKETPHKTSTWQKPLLAKPKDKWQIGGKIYHKRAYIYNIYLKNF